MGHEVPRNHDGFALQPVECPQGRYGDGSQDSCKLCAGNVLTDTLGRVGCEPCPLGSWNDGRLDSCQVCQGGYISGRLGTVGLMTCTPCPGGMYNPGNQDRCEFCLGGQRPTDTKDGCIPCEDGFYRPADSQSDTCLSCGAGHAASRRRRAATQCHVCSTGRFKSPLGMENGKLMQIVHLCESAN